VRHELHRTKEPQHYFPTTEQFTSVLEATSGEVAHIFTPAELATKCATPDEGATPLRHGHIALARRR
jgi:hypothetical protein